MEFLDIMSEQFESIYSDEELDSQTITITFDDIAKIIEFANMPLPELLLDIFRTGKSYGIAPIEENVVIQFLNIYVIAF